MAIAERLRNTLAHELCHVAACDRSYLQTPTVPPSDVGTLHRLLLDDCKRPTVVLSGKQVERRCDDTEVGTTHSYVINCKFNYECMNCGRMCVFIRNDCCC